MNRAILLPHLFLLPFPPPKVTLTKHRLFLVFSVLFSCDSLSGLRFLFLFRFPMSDWVFFGVFPPTYTQFFFFPPLLVSCFLLSRIAVANRTGGLVSQIQVGWARDAKEGMPKYYPIMYVIDANPNSCHMCRPQTAKVPVRAKSQISNSSFAFSIRRSHYDAHEFA
jgi:hypothetical protein